VLASLAHDIHFKNPMNSIVAIQIKMICHTHPMGSLEGPPGSLRLSKISKSPNMVADSFFELSEKADGGWAMVVVGLFSTQRPFAEVI